jgi:hypothetical protein
VAAGTAGSDEARRTHCAQCADCNERPSSPAPRASGRAGRRTRALALRQRFGSHRRLRSVPIHRCALTGRGGRLRAVRRISARQPRYRRPEFLQCHAQWMLRRVWQCVWAKLFQNAASLISRQAARQAILNGLLTHRIIAVMTRRREHKFNHDLSNRNAFYGYI